MKVSETWDLFGINTQQRLGQMGCFVWIDTRKLLPASKSTTKLITSEQNISPALIPQSVQKKTEGQPHPRRLQRQDETGTSAQLFRPGVDFPFRSAAIQSGAKRAHKETPWSRTVRRDVPLRDGCGGGEGAEEEEEEERGSAQVVCSVSHLPAVWARSAAHLFLRSAPRDAERPSSDSRSSAYRPQCPPYTPDLKEHSSSGQIQ